MITRFSKAFLAIVLALFLIASIALLHPPARAYVEPWTGDLFGEGGVEQDLHVYRGSTTAGVHGDVIMSKLGNATAKAELGRASWKLLHTMTLRFPEAPTQDEKDALLSFLHLFSRLYPCGECATDFQQLLRKLPPQTSSRRAAATWLCVVHNEVNKKLHKPEFDCANLDATYDCGCGDEPLSTANAATANVIALGADISMDSNTGVKMIKGGR